LCHWDYTLSICCSCRCAVTQNQSNAMHYTCESLIFRRGGSDPPPMHCNTGLGKMRSPQLRAALQNNLTAALCHWDQFFEHLLFIQVCSQLPLMHCNTGFGKLHSPQLFQTGSQQPCVNVSTPMNICCSYRCAVTHHQCTARLTLAKCIPDSSALLFKEAHSSLVSLQLHL